SDQRDLLQEAVNGHYSKPTLVWISHVSGNDAASDLSLIRVAPGDTAGTNIGAELDEAPSRKRVEVKLQSILKASSVSRTRHCCTTPIFVGAHCRRLATESVAKIDVKNWQQPSGFSPLLAHSGHAAATLLFIFCLLSYCSRWIRWIRGIKVDR